MYYECPRCRNVFPCSNQATHNATCTGLNPLPPNGYNLEAPSEIRNQLEKNNLITQIATYININDYNNDQLKAFSNFDQTFVCDICHQMLMEKEKNDHMLCHNLEKEDKKNEIRISRIDVGEQKEIEKLIEDNKRNMINQQRINRNLNNLNNNNNINHINNIPNMNNNNNNGRNINNNNHLNIYPNNINNPSNYNNININTNQRIREEGPNVQVNANQNIPNNEIRNINRYHQNNNNNIPNYNINYPNNLITFNRQRVRPEVAPIYGTTTILVNIPERSDNNRSATDKEILNNLPETQIEDVNKLDSEKKNCIICLEDFKNKDKAIILPCIHLFHKNCINNWLKAKNKCPICKFKLTGSNIDFQSNNFR